jgi:anti-anti-sigma factor
VFVDLSAVTFLDSAGVRVLNTLARDASDAGSELRLGSDLRPNVVQVLELTGMMAVLPMEDPS